MKRVLVLLVLTAIAAAATQVSAEDPKLPAEPKSVRKLTDDKQHNAFTALARWNDHYWVAYRAASGHNSPEGVIVVQKSSDGKDWKEAHRVNILKDNRDPQFLITPKRLFLYDPAMDGSKLTTYVTYTDDGKNWSKPETVYEPQFIFWKPLAHKGKYYATAHRKAEGNAGGKLREVHLITSDDGLKWKKVSTIRAGNWESETTIYIDARDQMLAFLRTKYSVPGHVLESAPPYTEWKQRDAGTHFSGHSVITIKGTTYLLSRTLDSTGKKSGTMIYTLADGKLQPYCALPSGGDCAYAEAAEMGDDMLVSYYSTHEGATSVYVAVVPLKK